MAEQRPATVLPLIVAGASNRGLQRLEIPVADPQQQCLASVASQVRSTCGWDPKQHVRFICCGRELQAHEPVAAALAFGSVVHCLRSEAPLPSGRGGSGSKASSQPPTPVVDWLEVVDPGTVLMWLFGSILALLWLLFIFYAPMFDRTSVIMLCIMTLAFLVPCVLSNVPCLRSLGASPLAAIPPAHSPSLLLRGSGQDSTAEAWRVGGYASGAVPPRPAARVRPGAGSHDPAAAPRP